ncbi:MAG: hypothetical protein ABSD89_06500 [Halobacteriota archaeon]
MEFKKVLVIVLVAALATTVVSAAGVLAAPNTKPSGNQVQVVSSGSLAQAVTLPNGLMAVNVGQSVTWLPWAYNVRGTTPPTSNGVSHTESSSGMNLATSVSAPKGTSGQNWAWVGVNFQLKGVTDQASWNAVKNRQVRISATVNDKLSAYEDSWVTIVPGGSLSKVPLSNQYGTIAETYAGNNAISTSSSMGTTGTLVVPLAQLQPTGGAPGDVHIGVVLETYSSNGLPATGAVSVIDIQLQWV